MRFWAVMRCGLAGGTLLVLGVGCGTGGEPNEMAGDSTAVATERSLETSPPRWDGISVPFGGGTYSAQNPFGLRGVQYDSAENNRRMLQNAESRAATIEAATSNPVRILLHMPGGWFKGTAAGERTLGMRGAIPTVAVMNGRKRNGTELYSWRWAVWADKLRQMANAHPDWVLGVYLSGYMPSAAAQDVVDAPQAYEPYDPGDARHQQLLMDLVDQWLAVGVDEFVLDGSSRPDAAVHMPDLASAIRSKGGHMLLEAHPHDREGNLMMPLIHDVGGSFSIHRYMVQNEPSSLDWYVPDGDLMMVSITSHETASGLLNLFPTPMATYVRSYRRRGFTILSGGSGYDGYVSQP
jgi:hypothetical protein